jgi:hypothetical protein
MRRQIEILKEFVKDFRYHGLKADLTPTRLVRQDLDPIQQRQEELSWYQKYVQDAQRNMMFTAERCLMDSNLLSDGELKMIQKRNEREEE